MNELLGDSEIGRIDRRIQQLIQQLVSDTFDATSKKTAVIDEIADLQRRRVSLSEPTIFQDISRRRA